MEDDMECDNKGEISLARKLKFMCLIDPLYTETL